MSDEKLFGYLMFVDNIILNFYIQEHDIGPGIDATVPTSLNASTYIVGDTVLVMTAAFFKDYRMSFENVVCENKETSEILQPRVTKIGAHYLLEYRPTQKGKYIIHGDVTFPNDPASGSLALGNQFIVR